MAKSIKEQITIELNVSPILINSSLVSAQNRERYYWTNIQNVKQPADRGISFQDIKETDYGYYKQFKVPKTPSRIKMWNDGCGRNGSSNQCSNITNSNKMHCITGKQDRRPNSGLIELDDFCRFLTTHELEKGQTLPAGYTSSVSRNQSEKCIGNGWTAEVIIHILQQAFIPIDEEIIVLSMYDGIATGRYCLDKMGYKNITYYAFEIDSNAMKVANTNYPDIIQCGDAFAVREENWSL